MFINRISPHEIVKHRIDAEYYSPEKMEQLTALRRLCTKWKSLDALCEFITDGTHQTPNYTASGFRFLSSTNIGESQIDFEKTKFVSETAFIELKRTKCSPIPGDILISKNGKVGTASVYREGYPAVGLFVSVALLRYQAQLDSDFVCAFLNSNGGQWQFKRAAKTGVITNLHLEEIREVEIPILDDSVQKYIGDKVRQAEQLRAWAKRCRGKINDYFDGLFTGISLTKPEHHHTRVSLDILVPRLNAEYYSDHYTQVEKGLLDRFGKLTTLGRLAPTVRAKVRPAADCTYKEIGDLDVGKGAFSSGTFYKYGEAPNNAQRIFDEGDVAVSTRRPNRGAVAVIEESSSTTFYSVFLARLKPKNKNFGYWLKEFLRHDAGKLLLLQRCTWTTYPVISEDDIETIPVPEIPNDWDFVARLSRQSVELEAFATNLTTSAKTLVEALIEGQLTEQQLIQAQQALGDGDNSLDQAVLSKLSSEGYGIEGATPLFSDIDELYRLLEGAAQAEAEE